MRKIILAISLVFLLVPIYQIGAQEYYDKPPTLIVSLQDETPFVYRDSDGYSVAVGLVENNDELTSVTNVQVQVKFYDDFDPQPVEVVTEHVSLEVIPPNGISPYSIRSATANPDITQASVSLLGFDSSNSKENELMVYSSNVYVDTELHFTGILENGAAPISNTTIYLAMHDAFDPPRILSVQAVEIGEVEPNGKINFEFNGKIDTRVIGFFMIAESDVFSSDIIQVMVPMPQISTKMVTISEVSIQDSQGKTISELQVGKPVNIKGQTSIQFATQQENETEYTFYIQIKESAKKPTVEYIGQHDGRFIGSGLGSQTISWIPQKPGFYFMETFVWDKNNIPLSDQGPIVLFLVK